MHLPHWGRVTQICVSNLTIVGSDNGTEQAITWTNAGILLIGPLGANVSEIFNQNSYILIQENVHLKMLSVKQQPFCLGLNVLKIYCMQNIHQYCSGLSVSYFCVT